MYEAYRRSHDGHTVIPEAHTNDIGSGSFVYDVDSNDTRRLHDIVAGVNCIPGCAPKFRSFKILKI